MNHKRGAFLSRDLVANTEAVELLCRIRKWISATGPACLVHPLGFCVVLLQKNDDEEWRFHVWPKGARRITGMPALIHTYNKVALAIMASLVTLMFFADAAGMID
jgi:hypothetical protein